MPPSGPSRLVYGSIAQLGEHLPYKQRVIGSSPIVSITEGVMVFFSFLPKSDSSVRPGSSVG